MDKLTTKRTEIETTVRKDLDYREMKTGQILTNKQEEKEVNAQIGKFKQNAVTSNPMSNANREVKPTAKGEHELVSGTPVTRSVNNYVTKEGAYKDPAKSFKTKSTIEVKAGETPAYKGGSSSRGVSAAQETPMEVKPLDKYDGPDSSLEDDFDMFEIDMMLEDF